MIKQIEDEKRAMISAIYRANEYDRRLINWWKKAKINGKLKPSYKLTSCFNNKMILINTIILKDEMNRRDFTMTCLDIVSNAIGVEESEISRRLIAKGLYLDVQIHKQLELSFFISNNALPSCQVVEKEEVYKSTVYVCTD